MQLCKPQYPIPHVRIRFGGSWMASGQPQLPTVERHENLQEPCWVPGEGWEKPKRNPGIQKKIYEENHRQLHKYLNRPWEPGVGYCPTFQKLPSWEWPGKPSISNRQMIKNSIQQCAEIYKHPMFQIHPKPIAIREHRLFKPSIFELYRGSKHFSAIKRDWKYPVIRRRWGR